MEYSSEGLLYRDKVSKKGLLHATVLYSMRIRTPGTWSSRVIQEKGAVQAQELPRSPLRLLYRREREVSRFGRMRQATGNVHMTGSITRALEESSQDVKTDRTGRVDCVFRFESWLHMDGEMDGLTFALSFTSKDVMDRRPVRIQSEAASVKGAIRQQGTTLFGRSLVQSLPPSLRRL